MSDVEKSVLDISFSMLYSKLVRPEQITQHISYLVRRDV